MEQPEQIANEIVIQKLIDDLRAAIDNLNTAMQRCKDAGVAFKISGIDMSLFEDNKKKKENVPYEERFLGGVPPKASD